MTLQLPNGFLVWGDTCFFISVLPGGTVLTGFLWSPQCCTLGCTVCRETLQRLQLGGRKNYDWESNCGRSLFTRFFFKLLMCISDCLHSPTGVSQPIAKWFQGLFLELACLLKSSTTHTGCTSNAHSTISNPPDSRAHLVLSEFYIGMVYQCNIPLYVLN